MIKERIKKIIAREVLVIVVSFFICLIAFIVGLLLDNQKKENIKELEKKCSDYDALINSSIIKFRKDPEVDSIYKTQMMFYDNYVRAVGVDSESPGNYFFWINVRKSIADSTFHLTYASDDIIDKIQVWQIRDFLRKLYGEIIPDKSHEEQYKDQFKRYALSNNYERLIPQAEWEKYESLRREELELVQKRDIERNNVSSLQNKYLENAILMVFLTLFLFRYIFYIVLWSIKTVLPKKNN